MAPCTTIDARRNCSDRRRPSPPHREHATCPLLPSPRRRPAAPCPSTLSHHGRRAELEARIRDGQGRAGGGAADPRPPLPAGRGDPVRRPPRRQLQARPDWPPQSRRCRCDRLLRRPLHGRDRRRPDRGPRSRSILPDMAAGCSMADMADLDAVEAAWADLGEVIDTNDLMPVTYINSAADLKAFCGRHGGIVCTSSQCPRRAGMVVRPHASASCSSPTSTSAATPPGRWAFRSTQMPVWNPRAPTGRQHAEAAVAAAGPSLAGHCSVHQMFRPAHVAQFREQYPGHQGPGPSRMHDVGGRRGRPRSARPSSSSRPIEEAPAGSTWAVGTELHLVNRLAAENPDKRSTSSRRWSACARRCTGSTCPTWPGAWRTSRRARRSMSIKVPDETAHWARVALERMLDVH